MYLQLILILFGHILVHLDGSLPPFMLHQLIMYVSLFIGRVFCQRFLMIEPLIITQGFFFFISISPAVTTEIE